MLIGLIAGEFAEKITGLFDYDEVLAMNTGKWRWLPIFDCLSSTWSNFRRGGRCTK